MHEGVQVFDGQQQALDPQEVQQLTPIEVAGVVGRIAHDAEELSDTPNEKVKIIVAAVEQAKEITGDEVFDERLFRRDVILAATRRSSKQRRRQLKPRIL